MYVGFVFNTYQASAELAGRADDENFRMDSGPLEKLAEKLGADYLQLNFEFCAFVLKKELSPAISLGIETKACDIYSVKDTNALSKALFDAGLGLTLLLIQSY